MTFEQALKILNIEDYSERICQSNSRGELFHLYDYYLMAEFLNHDSDWFRPFFLRVVKNAEQNWKRPESVYQHILPILLEQWE